MARAMLVQITCDQCGDPLPDDYDGFEFEAGDNRYHLDLCAVHLDVWQETIKVYTSVGELIGTNKRHLRNGSGNGRRPASITAVRSPARRDSEQLKAIRTWAKDNGFELAERGRIPRDVEEAYAQRGAKTLARR